MEDAAEKVAPDNKKSELRDVTSEVVISCVLLIIITDDDNKGLNCMIISDIIDKFDRKLNM